MNDLVSAQVVLTVVSYVAVFSLGGFCATVVGGNSIARIYGQARAALHNAQVELANAQKIKNEAVAMAWRQEQQLANGKDHGGVHGPASSRS